MPDRDRYPSRCRQNSSGRASPPHRRRPAPGQQTKLVTVGHRVEVAGEPELVSLVETLRSAASDLTSEISRYCTEATKGRTT